MNILIGILVLFILLAIIGFEVFVICALKINKKVEEPIEKEPQISEEQKEKEEKLRKSFNSLMEYDYVQALKGGKVKED